MLKVTTKENESIFITLPIGKEKEITATILNEHTVGIDTPQYRPRNMARKHRAFKQLLATVI
jgi:hypothetical protein